MASGSTTSLSSPELRKTSFSESNGAPSNNEVERILLPAPGVEASGEGGAKTFIYSAHPGRSVIDDFTLHGQRADYLSLPHTRFTDFADVLRNTTMMGADAVIHLSPYDSIKLVGVSKSELRADRNAIFLHS